MACPSCRPPMMACGPTRRSMPARPRSLPPGVPQLTEPASDPVAEAERVEKARLARMAGQARESQVFFRLQLKAPPREAVAAEVRPDPIPRPSRERGGRRSDDALGVAGGRARPSPGSRRCRSAGERHDRADPQALLPEIRTREGDLQSARPAEAGFAVPADGRHDHRRQPGQRPELGPPRLRHRPGDGERLRHGFRPAIC